MHKTPSALIAVSKKPLGAVSHAWLACSLLAAAAPARAQFIVSEVFADPSALSDAAGEFIEIANAGDRAESAASVRLVVDGDTLALGPVALPAAGHLLLCRDSAALSEAGAPCGLALPRLSLANSRPLAAVILWGGLRSAFDIPAAKPGVSWENTFDDERGLQDFSRSAAAFLAGDSATPGFRNSRSRRRARRDLSLVRAALADPAGRGGVLEAVIEDRGAEPAAGSLSVRADTDWDGIAETPVDSVAVPAGGGTVRVPLGPDHVGILEAVLGMDENPADNRATAYREAGGAGSPLVITEVAAAPEEGPEWAEIRNATGEGAGGGWPRSLDLARVEWNGVALGAGAGRLAPGEYLLLAEDAAALRARLGPLKVRVFEPPDWPALRNTGDTCRLALEGAPLDSLAYGSRDAEAGPSLARPSGSGSLPARPAAEETPGWQARPAAAALSLSLSARVLDLSRPLSLEVEAPAGVVFALRVYDLEGACRRTLGRGGEGRHAFAWAGEGERGKPLPPGPYIVCLSAGGRKPVRKVVALADGP